ncbi:hypothetical protein D3C81_1435170 [compost metagenome]
MAPAWFVTVPPAVMSTLPCAASVPLRFLTFAALMVSVWPAATVLGVCCHVTDWTVGALSSGQSAPGTHPWRVLTWMSWTPWLVNVPGVVMVTLPAAAMSPALVRSPVPVRARLPPEVIWPALPSW